MAVLPQVLAPGRRRRALLPGWFLMCAVAVPGALPPDVRRPIEALPPHVTGVFRDAARCEQRTSGDYLVFDRGGHAVFRVDPSRERTDELVRIGGEEGRLLQPMAFDVAQDGSFAVADAPFGRQRVQVFSASGSRLSWIVARQPGANASDMTNHPPPPCRTRTRISSGDGDAYVTSPTALSVARRDQ